MLTLESHVGTRKKVRVERNRPSEALLNGYVLARGCGLALMHCFDDFEPDGYVVIRERDIVSIRCGEYEELWDRMLAAEGLLGGLDSPPSLDLTSITTALASAAAQYPFLIVQCEDEHEDIEDFYLGQVAELTSNEVELRCVNALAEWESEPQMVSLHDITKLQIDTAYLKRFTKYIR